MDEPDKYDEWAFRAFALSHPHEAAEMDFERFAVIVRETVCPDITDEQIRESICE